MSSRRLLHPDGTGLDRGRRSTEGGATGSAVSVRGPDRPGEAEATGCHHVPLEGFAEVDIRRLGVPVFLMNLPLSLSTAEPNNIIMEQLDGGERRVDLREAIAQFVEAYRFVSQHALVYLLPSRPGLQDQTYVSNLGAVLHHLEEETVVVSRFRSRPRVDEAAVGIDFFSLLNFSVHRPPPGFAGEPLYFEGEADLKHIEDNLYVGARDMRTSDSALRWLGESFDMEIIPFPMSDPHLYHLDCCLLRLDAESVVLCTAVAEAGALRAIESRCEVIDIDLEGGYAGITNSVLIGDLLLCDTTIETIEKTDPWYAREKLKIETLERVCSRKGLQLKPLNMAEFYKSGAALSCLLMRLNHPRPTDSAGRHGRAGASDAP